MGYGYMKSFGFVGSRLWISHGHVNVSVLLFTMPIGIE